MREDKATFKSWLVFIFLFPIIDGILIGMIYLVPVPKIPALAVPVLVVLDASEFDLVN